MQVTDFDDVAELEDVVNGLARASRHPVHVDLGTEYREMDVPALSQETLEGEDVADRLGRVQPLGDLHAVWNNRDDERAYIGSQRYNLIQHREVIDAVREALGRTDGRVEKGVVRDYGAHVRGVLVFGNQDRAVIDVEELVGDGYVPPEGNEGEDAWGPGIRDRLGLGMRFHNSFNGRSGYGGQTMGYRFICQNWIVWGEETIAEKSSYHIKGSEDAPGVDPDYFEELIYEVFEQKDPLEGVVKDSIEEGEVPIEWTPGILERAGFGGNYQKNITARVLEQGRSDTTTLWNIYNAATAYLDHEKSVELGPERYDHHQGSAWAILENEPRPSEGIEDGEDLRAFAIGVEA